MACKPKPETKVSDTCPEDAVGFEEFYPMVAGSVKGASTSMMDSYIRTAVHEFLVDSQLVEEVVTLDIQAGVPDYYFDLPECWIPLKIKEVKICDDCYKPGQIHLCNNCDRIYEFNGQRLLINPLPEYDIANAMMVKLSVAPALGQCFIPRIVFDQYSHVIRDMVLSEMLSMKSMDWYDARLARTKELRYENEMNTVKASIVTRGGKLRFRGNPW